MECYCDDEPPVVSNICERTARKMHKCDECRRPIHPGEQYEQNDSCYRDTGWYHQKTCCRCLALRDYVKTHIPCFCWYFDDMINDALNEIREWAPECPGLLFGFYRLLVIVRRNKWPEVNEAA